MFIEKKCVFYHIKIIKINSVCVYWEIYLFNVSETESFYK